jgi:hypothetical protein
VGHLVRDQDDVHPLAFEEAPERLVVGPGRLERGHDLRAPRGLLGGRELPPEGGEAGRGVRDDDLGAHDRPVGHPELGHMLALPDVDPDEEPVPVDPQGRLQFPKALDSDGI